MHRLYGPHVRYTKLLLEQRQRDQERLAHQKLLLTSYARIALHDIWEDLTHTDVADEHLYHFFFTYIGIPMVIGYVNGSEERPEQWSLQRITFVSRDSDINSLVFAQPGQDLIDEVVKLSNRIRHSWYYVVFHRELWNKVDIKETLANMFGVV